MPRASVQGAQTTAFAEFELVLFIVYFATYVASNTSSTFEPSSSPAKHVVMMAIAACSLFSAPLTALRSLAIFAPLVLIYLFSGLATYALMAGVFALALPAVSRALSLVVTQKRQGTVALFLLIAVVPALVSAYQFGFGSLWTDQYGRERLLLGYWHPKEAAASFALPLILHILVRGRQLSGIALVLLPALLWVIGSRNVALAVYLFIGLWRYPRATFALLAGSVVAGIAVLFLLTDLYELFDELSSLRLSVWTDALADSSALAGDDLLLGSRLAIDSFYIEILASSGLGGLVSFAAWAVLFYWLLGLRKDRPAWSKPLFFAVLFFAAFDSGIVSTGNVVHITLWALAATPLLTGRRRRTRPSPPLMAGLPPASAIAVSP